MTLTNGTHEMSFQALFDFEQQLAEYTGAPYAVVTDSCTHALELCLLLDGIKKCEFTAYTYLSIPMLMHRLGIDYTLLDEQWVGEYEIYGTRIYDSARMLQRGMYRPYSLQCLSFGHNKPLSLGKGGAILTDDHNAYTILSMLRSDGRDLRISPWVEQSEFIAGFHYCPTLELCSQGLAKLPTINHTTVPVEYPDCRSIRIYDYSNQWN
jgi:dTDP-4-amino-4,6-dideoxygalactose transaminase